eukprot:scaffold79613_cov26-Tisochrysis_lutea.AAC.1
MRLLLPTFWAPTTHRSPRKPSAERISSATGRTFTALGALTQNTLSGRGRPAAATRLRTQACACE